MAGIYLHIPYCKKACHYCDFHFSTSLSTLDEMQLAMVKELALKKDILETESIETIYFGGGTPSAIPTAHIQQILEKIYQWFDVDKHAEITLEANPDDLTKKKIEEIKTTGINRFSIGIQSFFDEDLIWMNRAHNSQEAQKCIQIAQDSGFEDISIDLIYGFPLLSNEKWAKNIETALSFAVPHISCYNLTVEDNTALKHLIKKGLTEKPNEEAGAQQMLDLIDTLTQNGYEHYEISNFAASQRYARHNTNYWKNKPYLGIGPSAHSFYNGQRKWNVSHNRKYIQSILFENTIPEHSETLSLENRYNEYVMTRLRTQWGIDLQEITQIFEKDIEFFLKRNAEKFVKQGLLISENQTLKLSKKGKMMADYIASELFITE